MDSAGPIRLAFVDDHPTLLTGLAAIFSGDSRYVIVGTGAAAADALDIAATKNPEVLIVDLSMPGDVFGTIEQLTDTYPTLKIIVFTAFSNVELALKSLDAGAHAFVLKGRPADDLYEAIDTVSRGELFVSPEFSQRLVTGFRHRARRDTTPVVKLSARERQLVDCLLEGKTNKEIARTLELSEKTVKHYMTNLMNKLRVKNRLEVVLAVRALPPGNFDFSSPQ